MSKIVFIRPSYLEVQRAELVRVVLPSCWVVPCQSAKFASFKWLSFNGVVGVHHNVLPLKAGTQAELQLKTWGDMFWLNPQETHGYLSYCNNAVMWPPKFHVCFFIKHRVSGYLLTPSSHTLSPLTSHYLPTKMHIYLLWDSEREQMNRNSWQH